jgi:hypothetical protein
MAKKFFTCTVDFAGPGETSGGSSIKITLTDRASNPKFQKRIFFADPTRQKEMLATALAAITANLEVSARLESGNPKKDSEIFGLLLTRTPISG